MTLEEKKRIVEYVLTHEDKKDDTVYQQIERLYGVRNQKTAMIIYHFKNGILAADKKRGGKRKGSGRPKIKKLSGSKEIETPYVPNIDYYDYEGNYVANPEPNEQYYDNKGNKIKGG
jgi:predicted transcriptional regulator